MSLNGKLCDLRDLCEFQSSIARWPCRISSALSVMQMVLVRLIILRSNRTDALSVFIFFFIFIFPCLYPEFILVLAYFPLIGPMDMKSVAWLFIVLTSLHFDSLIMNPNFKHSFAPCHFYRLKKLVRSLWQYFKRQYFQWMVVGCPLTYDKHGFIKYVQWIFLNRQTIL